MMEYRNIEYAVVQGVERGVWKRSESVAGVAIIGEQSTRLAAVAAAETAIDWALAQKGAARPAGTTRLTTAVASRAGWHRPG
jgi:hypothetical protein